jgi:ligand-binding sensor domain-containing protein
MRYRRTLALLALPAMAVAGTLALVVVRVRHTLERTTANVAHEGEIAFEMRQLGGVENAGFQAVSSPAAFRDAAFFAGQLYISGPAGLFAYSADGTLRRSWRVGMDLPAAPLGAMAVGRLRGTSAPELMIATEGEGIVLLAEDGGLRQMRPAMEDAREVTAVLPLASGDLLIGTRRGGLLMWSGQRLSALQPEMAKLQVTVLAADGGGFWAGTRNAGVTHWHASTAEHVGVEEGMPDAQVTSIAVRGHAVFVGTPVGVEEFVDGHPRREVGNDLFAQALLPEPQALSPGPQVLTVATMDEGLRRVALDGRLRASGGDARAGNDAVQAFVTAEDGGVYAVTHDRVRRLETDGGWVDVIQPEPVALTDGDVSALGFDAAGQLWVGYFDRGLDIVSGDRTEHVEDDHVFCVNRIVLDPARQTMAVATANGLVLFDHEGKPRQVMTRRDGLIADHVTDVAFRPNGMTLATPAGLTFVDAGEAPQSLYAFEGLVNNHVYALGVRDDGETLAGTLGGLSVLRHETVERNLTATNSGLKHNWVTAIVLDDRDGWDVGTYGAGVMQVGHDGTVTALTPGFVVNPNAMLRTRRHLLVGSLSDGLWVETLSTGKWRDVRQGLPSKNVTALAERDGVIYVGTDNGLVKIAEEGLGQ